MVLENAQGNLYRERTVIVESTSCLARDKGLKCRICPLSGGKFFFFRLVRFIAKRTFVTFNTFWADAKMLIAILGQKKFDRAMEQVHAEELYEEKYEIWCNICDVCEMGDFDLEG
jgi:hypothetical protein